MTLHINLNDIRALAIGDLVIAPLPYNDKMSICKLLRYHIWLESILLLMKTNVLNHKVLLSLQGTLHATTNFCEKCVKKQVEKKFQSQNKIKFKCL